MVGSVAPGRVGLCSRSRGFLKADVETWRGMEYHICKPVGEGGGGGHEAFELAREE